MSGYRKKTSTIKYTTTDESGGHWSTVDPLDHCSLESFQLGRQ